MERTPIHPARRTAIALLLVAVVAAVPLAMGRPVSAAATFTVNRVADAADLDPSDGVCDVAPQAGAQCTLRAAIEQANASAGRERIAFDLAGPGVKTIRPASALPAITQPVFIDGYSQPGAKPNTAAAGTNAVLTVQLDGSQAGTLVSGLRITAANTVIRGLAINRFDGAGISFFSAGAAGVRVEGCFLGTTPDGSADRGNGNAGISSSSGASNIVVGGETPAARNLMSGNASAGVFVFSRGVRVTGNLIGTDKTGAGALGNDLAGVFIADSDSVVGANTIAFNAGDGVTVIGNTSVGNRILRNSIFANGQDGIDLDGNGIQPGDSGDGPSPNDPGDPDGGANSLQNKPVLGSATTAGGTTTIKGQLNSAANVAFVLRFFSNPSGSEGKVFRGQLNVVTNANGNAAFTFAAASAVPTGHTVTATATSEGGDTSEFSVPVVVS